MQDEAIPATAPATPGPIRVVSSINFFAGWALLLAAVVLIAIALISNGQLSVSQGDVSLRPVSGVVWLARIATVLCLGASATALLRARIAGRSGTEAGMARACLLGVFGGLIAALPALGSLLGVLYADELDAPIGTWALRFILYEPLLILTGTGPGAGPGTWGSVSIGRGLSPLQVLWLWPLGVATANATARLLTPSLTGALPPGDRRRELIWLVLAGLLGMVVPFLPGGGSGSDADVIARRYLHAVIAGGEPTTIRSGWADCPAELRAISSTNLTAIGGVTPAQVTKIRVKQRTLIGSGAAAKLKKYEFNYAEAGATNRTTWFLFSMEVTLADGSVRPVTLALSKYPGEWRVAPPKK